MSHKFFVVFVLIIIYGNLVRSQQCNDTAKNKESCGWLNMTKDDCTKMNCCWNVNDPFGPNCYHKIYQPLLYYVSSVVATSTGYQLILEVRDTLRIKYGPAISPLRVDVIFDTATRIRVKIYDAQNKRWEIPDNIVPAPPPPTHQPEMMEYKFVSAGSGEIFWFAIVRAKSGEVIFNTSEGGQDFNGLQFVDQYLEISTQLPINYNLYGLGEQAREFRLQPDTTYTLLSFGVAYPSAWNLYGSFPFYLEHRTSSASSHGVFLRNSNGMDILTNKTALTYRVIGGVLDFYFFMGPKPEDVISQFMDTVGRPTVPPIWSLGFHQCRWGYKNVQDLYDVISNYSASKIPLDAIWSDIDYMDKYKDFTLDNANFPPDKMNAFISQLHKNNQKYVVILDAGIPKQKGYSPYDEGITADIFIKNYKGEVFTGKVWPGLVAFPDFLNPNAQNWWNKQIAAFIKLLPVDGLWIDMNEVANFCDGECFNDSSVNNNNNSLHANHSLQFNPDEPPYTINNRGDHSELNYQAIDMSAVHYGDELAYNVRNLYGLTESKATRQALLAVRPNTRTFILSRSTFSGSGAYTSHWTGDNFSTWRYLYLSISEMLNFQLFGIPLVGSDICGFHGNTTEELCARWTALGAFYPFSRNHNEIENVPQELYRWESVKEVAKLVLSIRYSLLNYYYTQLIKINKGENFFSYPVSTLVKPLFFVFPEDINTLANDRQFMIGPALMLSPVLTPSTTTHNVYMPKGYWYDWFTYMKINGEGKNISLHTPLNTIQLHILGGNIVTTQTPGLNTVETRMGEFKLLVALDKYLGAVGDVYIDDGVTLDSPDYLYVTYQAVVSGSPAVQNGVNITAYPKINGHFSAKFGLLNDVIVMGMNFDPNELTLRYNGSFRPVNYSYSSGTLYIQNLQIDMTKDWALFIVAHQQFCVKFN